MRIPGLFEGLFERKKTPEQQWAENKAKEAYGQLQKEGYKNITVTVEVPQKLSGQQGTKRQAKAEKPTFVEKFRAERAEQIEARRQARQQSSQNQKHTQR